MADLMEKAKNYVVEKVGNMEKPEAEITDVDMKKVSMDSISYHANVAVKNPYSVPVPIMQISYALKCSGSIGSLGRNYEEDGVQNVTLTYSIFTGSDNGLRIKSWARPSTSFVKNIYYRNIVMKYVDNPIIIDQNYCPNGQDCPGQTSGVKISQVTYKNIEGTSTTEVAMKFDCSPSNPCEGIQIQDIKLTHMNKKAKSFCKNVQGIKKGVILPDSCI